jgi:hypothetical protein
VYVFYEHLKKQKTALPVYTHTRSPNSKSAIFTLKKHQHHNHKLERKVGTTEIKTQKRGKKRGKCKTEKTTTAASKGNKPQQNNRKTKSSSHTAPLAKETDKGKQKAT